jgi:hypothetical protein
MPIAAVHAFVKGLLDDLPMPLGLPAMAAYLNPPDPNVESEFPTAYILSASGPEKRDPKNAGSMPRNTGPGTPSGDKTIDHTIRILVVYELPSNDPDADTLFAGIMDGAMAALRYSFPNPAILTDPYTGAQTQAANTGEEMTYEKLPPQAISDERLTLWQGIIIVPIIEIISA